MMRFFIFLIDAVLCKLQILQPNSLANLYPNNIVPSATSNFGNPHFNDTFEGFVAFLPDSQDPCSELSLKFDIDSIVFIPDTNLECTYAEVAYEIQKCGGGGVIFNSTSSDYNVQNTVISLPDGWNYDIEIFAVMISYTQTFSWKHFGNSKIQLAFSSKAVPSSIPNILIELTGDHVLDTNFISDIYKYMMPLSINSADIEIYFNYSCKNCSPNDCYSNEKYCLTDSANKSSGRSMINQTLFEINVLNYIKVNQKIYADFFTYIKVISEYCESDYSDSCSSYVLDWLGLDSEEIQRLNNNSWVSYKSNAFWDNSILKSQISSWKSNQNLWFAPSITINSVKFLGGMSYFPQFFSDSFTDQSASSIESCAYGCSLDMIDDGVCESQCSVSQCYLDIEDCKSLSSGCNSTLLSNSICDSVCNSTEYDFDNWICVCKCNSTLLGNGKCDSECNTEICNYDYKDCETTSQCNCTDDLLNNEECDPECNTEECSYDNYACNNTKEDSDDKSVGITKSQIALIVGIVGGSFLLLLLGSIALCLIYRRAKYLSSPRNHDPGESRNISFNANNAENQGQPIYQQYANRLPSRINPQQRGNNSPRVMQYPDILNSEMAASNDESEASRPVERSVLEYEFYGDPICTICLEKVSKRKQEITSCFHIFHKKCLKEWKNKKGKASLCPNCNKDLS